MRYYTSLYNQIQKFRNPNKGKLIENKTRLWMDHEKTIYIKHHETNILALYPDGRVRLSNGGWYSRTTKSRMNSYLPSDVRIFSKNGEWVVELNRKWYEFENGMIINTSTNTTNTPSVSLPRSHYKTFLLEYLASLGVKRAQH